MARLLLSFILALALVLAGAAIEYDAINTNSPLRFFVALIAMGLGLAWLWSTAKETRRFLVR
jgi:fucose permease